VPVPGLPGVRAEESQSMSDLIIFGFPQSTYVRTVRMVCEEKGVSYEMSLIKPGSAVSPAVHPFGRVPAIQHGDVHLYETSAIARYIDEVFPGPSLVPATPLERATMERWISAINGYVYDDLIRKYAFAYIFPRGADGKPDRAVVDASLPSLTRDLHLLDKGLAGVEWLAGNTLSLADLFIAPILSYVGMFPEGQAIMADCPNMKRVGGATTARASFEKTATPRAG
jgi:glutathione S-transferase